MSRDGEKRNFAHLESDGTESSVFERNSHRQAALKGTFIALLCTLFVTASGTAAPLEWNQPGDPVDDVSRANVTMAEYSPLKWEPTMGPKGGYSRYLVHDATDERVVYGAFWPSGVWKSEDRGETWVPHNDGLPVLSQAAGVSHIPVSALAIADSSPGTLYAGTGGGGIYKSVDGAQQWEQVYQTPDEGDTGNPSPVQLIAVSPHDERLVFAGTNGGSFYVSRDGGATWSSADEGMEIRGSATGSIAFDPDDASVVYFGPSFFDIEAEGQASGLYKSTDAGRTWRSVGDGLASDLVNAIAIDTDDPNHLFVATGSTFSWGYGRHGVFESSDGGETFEPVGADFAPFQHAVPYIAYSRHDDRILVGNHPGHDGGLFVSEDGGQTWTSKTGLWGDFVTDIVEFEDPDRLLATAYWSGVFLSEDGGETWRDVGGHATPRLHAVYAPGFAADRVYAAAHSNGLFYSDDRGETWTRVGEGDGGVIHESIIHNYGSSASRFSPDLLWIRGEFSNEVIVLRDVTDPAWGSIPVPGQMSSVLAHPTASGRAYVGSDRGLFTATYPALELRPTNGIPEVAVTDLDTDGTTVVVGTGDGVYASRDDGETWQQLGLGGRPVTAVTVRGTDVYAAIDDDGVYHSSGAGFERRNDMVEVTQIVVDPGDARTVYFAGTRADGRPAIYASADKGATVVLEAADLPTIPTTEPHRLSFSADGTTLYLATVDSGVWKAHVRDEPLAVSTPGESSPTEATDSTRGVPASQSPSSSPESDPTTAGTDEPESFYDGEPTVTVETPGFGVTVAVIAFIALAVLSLVRRD